MVRQTGGTEGTVSGGTEEGEAQWDAASGKRPCKPWTLRLVSMDLTGNLQGTLHTHCSAIDRTQKT